MKINKILKFQIYAVVREVIYQNINLFLDYSIMLVQILHFNLYQKQFLDTMMDYNNKIKEENISLRQILYYVMLEKFHYINI